MKIACVILAAGRSKRFGAPKALARFQNKSLLEYALDAAIGTNTDSQHLVLGANRELIESKLDLNRVNLLINENFKYGMSSSIITAIENLPLIDAILFMTVDQPLLTSDHLNTLIERFKSNNGNPVAAYYAGDIGIPAIIPAVVFPDLRQLRGDRGAKTVLEKYSVANIPLPDAEFDIDTPEDLHGLMQQKN